MTARKSNNELLEEGAKSYPSALLALMEFRRQIQDRCRVVVEKTLKDQVACLGVKLTRDMIALYAEPDYLSAATIMLPKNWTGE